MAKAHPFILNKNLKEKKIFAGPYQSELRISDHEEFHVANHWQALVEMLYIKRGCCDIIIHNEEFTMREGDLLVVNPGEMHAHNFDGKSYLEFICTKFDPVILEDPNNYVKNEPFSKDFKKISTVPSPPPSFLYRSDELTNTPIPAIILNIQKEIDTHEIGYDLSIRSGIQSLYVWLLRRWNKEAHLTASNWHNSAYKRLVVVFQYIQENYSEDISTSNMADILAVSVPHFCRSFKKIAGCSFHNYLQSFRVSEAARFLLSTDSNINQIASMVGYEDVNFFIRVFGKHTGMSPMKYRKKWEAENLPLILQH
jgi:AraC-like DNA-binding protein